MPNPVSVEKMQIVVDSLLNNPEVVVVGGFENNYLKTRNWPLPKGFWSRTLDILVHPVEPRYDADELNDLMFNLVPELEPSGSDRFRDDRTELLLGKLYYDEHIGTASLSATVQLKEGLSVVNNGELAREWVASKTIDLQQRTWVSLFPDEGHLLDAAEGKNGQRIPSYELGRSVGGRVVAALYEAPMLSEVNAAHQEELPPGTSI